MNMTQEWLDHTSWNVWLFLLLDFCIIIKFCLKSDTLSGSWIYLLICHHKSYQAAYLFDWFWLKSGPTNRAPFIIWLTTVHTLVPWMRSIDEKKNTKYLSRIFCLGKALCHLEEDMKGSLELWSSLINPDCTRFPPPLCAHRIEGRLFQRKKKGLRSHLCGFTGK